MTSWGCTSQRYVRSFSRLSRSFHCCILLCMLALMGLIRLMATAPPIPASPLLKNTEANNKPLGHVVVVAAGMPRSGSTWQYNCARLILKHLGLSNVTTGFVDTESSFFFNLMDEEQGSHVFLIKAHRFVVRLAQRADVILTSHRDLRDVFASLRDHCATTPKACNVGVAINQRCVSHLREHNVELMHMYKHNQGITNQHNELEKDLLSIESLLLDYECWRSVAHLDLVYEEMMDSPRRAVADLVDEMLSCQKLRNLLIAVAAGGQHMIMDRKAVVESVLEELEATVPGNSYDHRLTMLHPKHRFDGRHCSFRTRLNKEEIKQMETHFSSYLARQHNTTHHHCLGKEEEGTEKGRRRRMETPKL